MTTDLGEDDVVASVKVTLQVGEKRTNTRVFKKVFEWDRDITRLQGCDRDCLNQLLADLVKDLINVGWSHVWAGIPHSWLRAKNDE